MANRSHNMSAANSGAKPDEMPYRVELRTHHGRDLCVYGFDDKQSAYDHYELIAKAPAEGWTSVAMISKTLGPMYRKRFRDTKPATTKRPVSSTRKATR